MLMERGEGRWTRGEGATTDPLLVVQRAQWCERAPSPLAPDPCGNDTWRHRNGASHSLNG